MTTPTQKALQLLSGVWSGEGHWSWPCWSPAQPTVVGNTEAVWNLILTITSGLEASKAEILTSLQLFWALPLNSAKLHDLSLNWNSCECLLHSQTTLLLTAVPTTRHHCICSYKDKLYIGDSPLGSSVVK